VKLTGPKDQTLPFALCFKTFNVREILRQSVVRIIGATTGTAEILGKGQTSFPKYCFGGISEL